MKADILFERTLKRSGRLFIGEGGTGLWASDSYWAVPVDEKHPIARLLEDYNLTLEPGNFFFGKTLKPIEGPPQNFAKFLDGIKGKRLPLTPVLFGAERALVCHRTGDRNDMGVVYERTDGLRVVVNQRFLDLVAAASATGGQWEQAEKPKVSTISDVTLTPLAWVVKKKVHALLMPIRVHGINTQQQEVAA
jgi:hypothetical protein